MPNPVQWMNSAVHNSCPGPYTTSAGRNYPSDELSGEWGYVDQRLLDAIEYWLGNKAGADFICIDGNLKETCWADDYRSN